MWRSDALQVEGLVEGDLVERHVGILLEQLTEIGARLPGRHRVALHDPVGVVTRPPGGHERQQHRLAEHQTVARPQVLAHPFGVDLQTREQSIQSADHVVDEQRRVREHDPLDR